jgi:hypothetical protein
MEGRETHDEGGGGCADGRRQRLLERVVHAHDWLDTAVAVVAGSDTGSDMGSGVRRNQTRRTVREMFQVTLCNRKRFASVKIWIPMDFVCTGKCIECWASLGGLQWPASIETHPFRSSNVGCCMIIAPPSTR